MRREPPSVESLLGRESPASRLGRTLTRHLHARGLHWDGLGSFLRCRHELCEIDARFGQLGERGIFSSLDENGVLCHHVSGVYNVEQAVERPPSVGRARVRGDFVRQLSGDGRRYLCDWRGIWDCARKRRLDLSDPFDVDAEWRDVDPDEGELFVFRSEAEESFMSRLRRAEQRSRRTSNRGGRSE
jgi:hypothetical protein